jgi:hypothetical protein
MPTGMVCAAGGAGEGKRDDELVPGDEEEPEEPGDPQPRQRQRQHDAHQRPERTEAVDAGGVDQLVGKPAEEAGEDPDHQRQHDRQVSDDQPERVVDQPERAELQENGNASAIGGNTG